MTYSSKRAYRLWTAEQVAMLARDWPVMSRSDLETRYGRDGETLRATLRRWGYSEKRNKDVQYQNSAQAAERRWAARRNLATGDPAALSGCATAAALGIDTTTIINWIARGWITASRARMGKARLYGITPKAIERFLRERGGTLDLYPAPEWKGRYEQARHTLRAQMIQSVALLTLMQSSGDLAYFRRRCGMPEPALRNGSKNGGDWYDRKALRAWLDANPHRHTPQTRAALG